MDIAYPQTSLANFHRARKSKSKGKRNKGRPKTECLEKPFCPKAISTEEYNRLLLTLPYKVHPICFNLLKIDWAIFGSLTWKQLSNRRDTPEMDQKRFNYFYSLIRWTCREFDLKEREIEYFVTSERGRAGECHLHFLISKRGLKKIAVDRVCLTMKSLWKQNPQLRANGIDLNRTLWGVGGEAEIVPFDQKRKFKGVSYVCKREFDEFGNEYFKEYKLSTALARHITEINSALEKPPPSKPSQGKSIKKYFCSVSVRHKSVMISKECPQRIRMDRHRFKTRDPPSDAQAKDRWPLYEKFRLTCF